MAHNTMKWGTETAKKRYGNPDEAMKSGTSKGQAVNIGLIDQPMVDEVGHEMYAPQSANDHRGTSYENDTPDNWLRGKGGAEGKPSFDKRKKG